MQAVILTAGASIRFYPLSEGRPKPMVSLLGKPLLAWTISSLVTMGIKEIILVVSPHSPVEDYFADGQKFGAKINYVQQEKPAGMGDALLKAKTLIKEDFFLLHGHHLDIAEFIKPMVEKKRNSDGVLLTEERENFWEYGVLEIEGERAKSLTEKPTKDKSGVKPCVVGIYLLSPDFISFLENTPAGHYQLEEALDKWIKVRQITAIKADKETVSLKYPWDLFRIKNYLLERMPHRISRGAKIGKGVILSGKMIIEEGATILENATIKGPAYLGKNCLVGNSTLIRSNTVLEENVSIGAFSDIKNSIILSGAHLGNGFIASSIIGENSRLGHNFTTANKRFDREMIKVNISAKEIDSGLTDLGVIMGEHVDCGIGVGTMPGITIGSHSTIGPGTFVFEDVAPGANLRTEFKNILKK